MTRVNSERNKRAVDIWFDVKSWAKVADQLEAEGFKKISRQAVSQIVNRELRKAWEAYR